MRGVKRQDGGTHPNCTGCTAGTAGGSCGTRPSLCPWGSWSPATKIKKNLYSVKSFEENL